MGERVAIVGSRKYKNKVAVYAYVAALPADTTVVSGGASGPDTWGVLAARAAGLAVKIWAADWDRYGRSAGMLRNKDIEKDSDRCAAFWDGASRGTANTIGLFEAAGKPVEVIRE